MIQKLTFALEHYALLSLFALSAFGWGYPITRWIPDSLKLPMGIIIPYRLACGLGVLMISLIVIASLGLLQSGPVSVLLIIGLVLNLIAWKNVSAAWKGRQTGYPAWETWPWIALVTAVVLPLLIKPLVPPQDWDELAYHLPYARFWAEQGSLAINPWLRFPLMPYNMQLLYSAALVFGNDVLPHLLHALTAALTLVLTFAFGRRYMDWKTAVIAVLLLSFATRWGWSTASVDFGVMLFWSCAFVALALRHESSDSRFLYLASFFAGLAIGVKYQALLYVPVFAALVLCMERRLPVLVRAVVIFMLAGGFWYLRNFVVSGNPVHPVAGQWFGYWIWTADDLAGQNADLERIRAWPPWYLVCSVGAFLFWRGATRVQKTILLVTATSVSIWAVISGYPRYLTAIYPMLALLAAHFMVGVVRQAGLGKRVAGLWNRMGGGWQLTVRVLVISVLMLAGFLDVFKVLNEVKPDPESREAMLTQTFKGYALLQSIPEARTGVIYQLGFEGELYYLGPEVRGDWFGPGRYQDLMLFSNNAPALAQHLEKLGADSLLINRWQKPFSELKWHPAMEQYFQLLGQTPDAALYRLKPPDSR